MKIISRPEQGRRITVSRQNPLHQRSNCFSYKKIKYGYTVCPWNVNERAFNAQGTDRARMGPHMRDLERVVGYRSTKAKFSNIRNMEEWGIDE